MIQVLPDRAGEPKNLLPSFTVVAQGWADGDGRVKGA